MTTYELEIRKAHLARVLWLFLMFFSMVGLFAQSHRGGGINWFFLIGAAVCFALAYTKTIELDRLRERLEAVVKKENEVDTKS